jgi:hypothetical protein
MQYNGPFDQPSSPDAPYVNGNPATGTQGSIPPAAAFEYPQREMANFIIDNSQTPSNADLHQLSRGLQYSSVIYAADTGTADNLVIALNPIPIAHKPGMTVRVKKSNVTNTGTLTLNDGLGANQLLKADGSAFNAGEMPANMVFEATWDGASWKTINFLGMMSTEETIINNFVTNIPYCVDTSVTANAIIAPYSPPITTLSAGSIVAVKLNRAFTGGPVTIAVNALGLINLKRGDGQVPLKGDGYVGQILLLEHDGTFFQIINSNVPSGPLPIILADQKPNGTEGGSFSQQSWRTRDLNTVVADPFGLVAAGLCTLSGNRFTLQPGTWEIYVRAPAIGVADHELRVWNVTDNTLQIKGEFYDCGAAISTGGDPSLTLAMLEGILVLTSAKTFEIQHICEVSRSGFGFGTCQGGITANEVHWSSPSNGPETYTVVSMSWSR